MLSSEPSRAPGDKSARRRAWSRVFVARLVPADAHAPRHGMGIASIQLNPGALDPFRANRMRMLILSGTLLLCDLYWQLVPGPATFLKAPLSVIR
jgi:hypothetical protein